MYFSKSKVPQGRSKIISRPFGTYRFLPSKPSDKSLGYFHNVPAGRDR